MEQGDQYNFIMSHDGTLSFRDCLWALDDPELRLDILKEAYASKLDIHPDSTKIYQDLRLHSWWPNMEREINDFVSRCLTCQQVKVEYRRPSGLL